VRSIGDSTSTTCQRSCDSECSRECITSCSFLSRGTREAATRLLAKANHAVTAQRQAFAIEVTLEFVFTHTDTHMLE
jgi:hypothetical protein